MDLDNRAILRPPRTNQYNPLSYWAHTQKIDQARELSSLYSILLRHEN